MQIKKLKISKLFYNKWPFKVSCVISHARLVTGRPRYYGAKLTAEQETNIEEFKNAWATLSKEEIHHRAEFSHFNIFCSTRATLDLIISKLKPWISIVSEPASDEELEFLIENGHKIRVCEKYPSRKYHYRIYLKTKMSAQLRKSFLDWSIKYNGKIKPSKITEKWLVGTRYWISDPFCYVQDSATLSMVGLFLGNDIKLVEKFVLRTSINTPSE